MLPKWNLADIQERMFNRPLMVRRDKAEIALGVLGPKLNIGSLFLADSGDEKKLSALTAQAAAEMEELPGDRYLKKIDGWTGAELDPYEIWNGAAIFPVRGTLMAEVGIDPVSGATGYDGLGFKTRHALANSKVKGAILDIDSGGGECVDLLELCSELRSFAERKPLRAIVRGQACSAAYALAACAGPGNITGAPYSLAGNIGAIMMHADFSKALEQDGIDVTMLVSAAHKGDANPYEPLPGDVAARLQAMVDSTASDFIDHVAEARSQSRDGIVAQEARFYSGKDALELGLIDKFMSWDDSMREFAAGLNSPARPGRGTTAPSGARSVKGHAMSTENPAPAAESQPGITEDDREEIRLEAHAAGKAEGEKAAIAAERERIGQLAELDASSTISPALSQAISDGTGVADFALAQARAKKDGQAAALAAGKADAVPGNKLPEGSAPAQQPTAQPESNRGKAYAARKQAAASAS